MDKAKETLGKFWNSAKDKWSGISKNVRIIIIAVLSALIITIITLSLIFSRTDYVVLYSNLSQDETTAITGAIGELGYTDIQIKATEILVPSTLADTIRMQLSMQGYPQSGFNYNIWDEGIGAFSTDKEKAVKNLQQLQSLIMATLNTIPEVDNSMVIISMEEEKPYVISTDVNYEVKATVKLNLKPEKTLTNKQVDGIYNLVMTSVPRLDRENISITDGNAVLLIPDDGPTGAEELILFRERLNIQKQFQDELEVSLENGLKNLLSPFVRDFSVDVKATLDYGKTSQESKSYTPSVAADGTRGGMVESQVRQEGWGGYTPEGGGIGTTVDADISPDYPNLIANADTDVYYERLDEVKYKVNEVLETYVSDEYTVGAISASVILDGAQLTEAERMQWQNLVANAIGTTAELVSVLATPVPLDAVAFPETNPSIDPTRNTLIIIIIALGVVLIVLFLLAIMTSGSKKKRQVYARYSKSRPMPVTGDLNGGLELGLAPTAGMTIDPETGEPINVINIASLLPEGGEDTKEAVLKREIRDFSAQNPDIVAQLIRQWMLG